MNNEYWCVDFSLNGELQDVIDFFDTEEEAVEYCLKEANISIEDCRGRRYHPSILHRKDKRIVEIYFFDDKYVWRYYPYSVEEIKKLLPNFNG